MTGRELTVRVALTVIAVYLIGLSLLMVVSPGTFYAHVGPFGARSDHDIRDAATFQFVFGLAAIAAAQRREWRVFVLAGLALQFGLHSINHLVDIGNAHPGWIGPVDFAGLAATTVLLVWMLVVQRSLETVRSR